MIRRALSISISIATITALGCGPSAAPADPQAGAKAPVDPGPPVDRGGLPKAGPAPSWAPPEPERWTMSNGLDVWFVHQGQAPLISLRLVFPHGAATDPENKSGLTSLMADMLDEGAGDRDALTLDDAFQRLATDYHAETRPDSLVVSMSMLADGLAPSLSLLSDILERPRLTPEDFERRKQQRVAQALAAEAQPRSGHRAAFNRVLYGEGYGGLLEDGVRGHLENLTLEDIKAQYQAMIQPQGAAVVVVGAVDKAALAKALSESLGGWTGEPTTQPRKVRDGDPQRAIHIVDYPGAQQTVLAMATRAQGAIEVDGYFEKAVFARVFGSAFTSRLNMNLREDKGYTYGARGTFDRAAAVGEFTLMAQVKTDTTRASMDEMVKEIDAICKTRPISFKEHQEAVNGLALGFPGRFENMDGLVANLMAMWLWERPVSWLTQWTTNLRAVDLEGAEGGVKPFCNLDAYAFVLAGDRETIEPTFEGLGLDVIVYDAQGERVK